MSAAAASAMTKAPKTRAVARRFPCRAIEPAMIAGAPKAM